MVQTIAEYQQKDNPYVKKFTAGIDKLGTNMANFNPLKTDTVASSTAQQSGAINPAGGITALGNTAGQVANPNNPLLQGTINTQPFQPMYSGRQKNGMYGQSYNRMSAINDITDLADAAMQQRVDSFNQKVRARNAAMQSQSTGSFYGDGTGSFFGGGSDSGLDDEQLTNARAIANIGRQRGMSDGAIQIALMTALTESGLRNLSYGDRDSVGLFQQRTSQGWGTIQQIMDPTYSANKFYDALSKVNYGAMNPWNAAQAVQRSFDPSGSNYQKQWQLAQRAFSSLNSNTSANLGNSQLANWITQNNNKYIDYDGYFGAQCVDLYNAYTASFVGGKNYMVGYADEIFNNYDRNAYTRVGATSPGAMGYVAVFGRGAATPFSHVAIVVGDNGNGTLRVLQANATPQGSAGNTIISNISKASLMGYLIPNKLMGR